VREAGGLAVQIPGRRGEGRVGAAAQHDATLLLRHGLHGGARLGAEGLGRPQSITTLGMARAGAGSAAKVMLTYPDTHVECSATALMPKPYGVRGGYLATFDDAVLESAWTAGWDGRPTGTLTEYSDAGARELPLPQTNSYAAVIDHVLDCLGGRASSRLTPASVFEGLQLTLDVRDALTAQAR
jgi:UDP-N-acetylglucosamine 3-dehydrogenase